MKMSFLEITLIIICDVDVVWLVKSLEIFYDGADFVRDAHHLSNKWSIIRGVKLKKIIINNHPFYRMTMHLNHFYGNHLGVSLHEICMRFLFYTTENFGHVWIVWNVDGFLRFFVNIWYTDFQESGFGSEGLSRALSKQIWCIQRIH